MKFNQLLDDGMRDEFLSLAGMKLETRIAKTQTFDVLLGDLPLSAVRKTLRYGFQRWINDRVGGTEIPIETKLESTSLFLGDVLNDVWQTSRSAPVSNETNVRRKVTLANLSADEKKSLVDNPDRAEILDATFAENILELQPLFEAEMKRLAEPKPKIKLSVKIASKA